MTTGIVVGRSQPSAITILINRSATITAESLSWASERVWCTSRKSENYNTTFYQETTMKSMKLLSSAKKSSRPSSAASNKPPPSSSSSGNTKINGPIINESLLQLQLENTHLRSKLDALLNTDESKSELLSLLQQQTLDNEQLQQKVQMLNSGLVEIDKERKRLVKAAHSAQADLHMVRQ